ncbi:tyrosine-type recombinase/integrase [Novosphingobium flavum]|uniref:Tyrosine-type recombinase/integrase n=1 Tax=Novosphingobium flavum TaxID=1778672 RepID=A0A7X1KLX9_9SPHN|nr:site-specific integrase [Novosphingobium flavum]MBC2666056.1 tyrosine-type recombinase/integrase [Novosphingobium flavum]
MPTAKLDATFALTAQCKPGKKRTDYYDTAITGFTLECHASGVKTYALRYFDSYGRQRQKKIGGYTDITFAVAQKAAKRLRAEVVMGGSPAEEKADKKAVPTYNDLADQHIADVRTYSRNPDNIDRVLKVHLRPKWGKQRLDEITAQEIAKWLAEKRESGLAPATVEKIRIIFNRSFELALRWNTPGVKANPVRGIPRPRYDNKRNRYLTADEAARLLEKAKASANSQLHNIVRLLLYTGARKNELLKAKWADVDLDRKLWYIPVTKTGKPRHVPLSQAALDVIGKLPRWDKCPWLIPNPKTRKPFTDIKHPWQTARDAAGLGDLHIHDLRHSAASFMVNAGIDLFAVGRILGHADHQSTMRYAHLANDTLMRAVEAGALQMQAASAQTKAA